MAKRKAMAKKDVNYRSSQVSSHSNDEEVLEAEVAVVWAILTDLRVKEVVARADSSVADLHLHGGVPKMTILPGNDRILAAAMLAAAHGFKIKVRYATAPPERSGEIGYLSVLVPQ